MLLNLINRVSNRPLLTTSDHALLIYDFLSDRVKSGDVSIKADSGGIIRPGRDGYAVIDGVAVIPVEGSLVHKSGYIGASCGVTGYDGIRGSIYNALNDASVEAIMLDVNSPGGEVSGAFALADYISKVSAKPIYAHANELMCSAALLICSGVKQLFAAPGASVGSIGALWVHTSYAKKLELEGVKPTIISSGKHKASANPYEDLPKDVYAKVTGKLDAVREQFALVVSEGRKISYEAAMSTEADVLTAEEAMSLGLVDKVLSFDDALSLCKASSKVFQSSGVNLMSETSANQADDAVLLAAVSAERSRIMGIVKHEHAVGRMSTAIALAESGMSVESAIAVLATVPAQNDKVSALRQFAETTHVRGATESDAAPKAASTIHPGLLAALGV